MRAPTERRDPGRGVGHLMCRQDLAIETAQIDGLGRLHRERLVVGR